MMQQKKLISFDGTELFYVIHKNTDMQKLCSAKHLNTLVFIHGLSGNHTVWKHSLAYFISKGYCVVALDLCGHGYSHKNGNRERYSIENFAHDLRAILEKENVENPILIGHSLGGMIALHYDFLFPDHAKKLVLIATPPRNPLQYQIIPLHYVTGIFKLAFLMIGTIATYIKRRNYPYIDYTTLKKYNAMTIICKDLQGTPLQAYMWTLLSMLPFTIEHHLPTIQKPVLLITGEHDFAVAPKALQDIKNAVPHAQLEIMKATDHLNPIRRPHALNNLLERFIQR